MSHTILITGGSGYLGGSLLACLSSANLPPHSKLYALVRTPAQAQAVKEYGAEPLTFNAYDEADVNSNITSKKITVVYHLIDAGKAESQKLFIKALSAVKKKTGSDVHFLHTTGAKIFSSHAGAPLDRNLTDDQPDLYEVQKAQVENAPHQWMKAAVIANNEVIELAEDLGVRAYIFAPCIVYGKGEGFGNPISIQTTAIVKAAKGMRKVYRTDQGRPTWPVCHVSDNTKLYIELLRAILAGGNPDYGKNGYYLAASGSVAWDDLYAAIAKALAERGVIDNASVETADDAALEKMGEILGCPKEFVPVQVGGRCTFAAEHGKKIGWKATHEAHHILEAADAEVELILQTV